MVNECFSGVSITDGLRGFWGGRLRVLKIDSPACIKLAVTLALAGAIWWAVDVPEAMARLLEIGPTALIISFSLLCAQLVAAAWRWHVLLHSVGAKTRFSRDFQIYMSASVANLAFLPQIGSLSVRAYLAVRDGVKLGSAVGSLVLERLLVLFALIVAFLAGAALLGERVADIETIRFILFGFIGIVLAMTATGMLLRFIGGDQLGSSITRLRTLARQPGRAAMLILSSLFVLYSGFAAVAVIALGLNADVPLIMLFAIQPVVAVLAALPISFGGWGVREGSMVVSLGLVGVSLEDALAISVAAVLAGLVTTLAVALAVQVYRGFRTIAKRTAGINRGKAASTHSTV